MEHIHTCMYLCMLYAIFMYTKYCVQYPDLNPALTGWGVASAYQGAVW